MNIALMDEFDDDEPAPFLAHVGRRALPPRESVQPEPEPMTALDRAVHYGAFGGVWLTVKPDDVDEITSLFLAGVGQFSDDLNLWQLTVQGAREMGLLPIDQLAYPDAEIVRDAGVSAEMGEGE